MDAQDIAQNRLMRERKARKEAERLLESKSRELYRANQDLQGLADGLEQQVEERTRELIKMRDQALEGSRVKSAFLANMSHEIRTPLSGIIGMSELLLESPLSTDQKDRVEVILDSSRALLRILNDILDISKLEAGKLELRERHFDICQLLDDVAETLSQPMRAKRLELQLLPHPGLPRYLSGDDARLRQILLNLLSNAIKFTAQGHIAVTARAVDESAKTICVRFEVSDTGIGIAPEDQALLFRKFNQLDTSYERNHQGTGLGLSICKNLAERMGGTIGCRSEISGGSTFWFTARMQRSAAHEIRDASPTAALVALKLSENVNTTLNAQLSYLGLDYLKHNSVASLRTDLEHTSAPPPMILVEASNYAGEIRQELTALRALTRCHVAGLHWDADRDSSDANAFDADILRPITHEKLIKTLTTVQQSVPKPAPGADTVHSEKRKRILLAEDSKALQVVTRMRLEKLGYRVFVASNGREALDILATQAVDLVLMDIQMPEMDGLTTTRHIRDSNDHALRTLPVIALTAYAMKGDEETFRAAGMNDYLTKPLESEALVAALGQWL